MKKFTIISLCFMLTMILGISTVKADDTALVPFVKGVDTASMNTMAEVVVSDAKKGESIELEAYVCPVGTSNFDPNTSKLNFSKANCTAASATTWTSSNPAAVTVANGVISYVSEGVADVTGQVGPAINEKFTYKITVVAGTPSQNNNNGNNTNNNTNNNSTNNSNNNSNSSSTTTEDEPSNVVQKEPTVAKEELIGKQTTANPKTGILDSLIYVIPICLAAGSLLVFKRRMA